MDGPGISPGGCADRAHGPPRHSANVPDQGEGTGAARGAQAQQRGQRAQGARQSDPAGQRVQSGAPVTGFVTVCPLLRACI